MDTYERKKLQNKLSQRKHRQKQKQRIEVLEHELEKLNKKFNQCLYEDQSKVQLLKIYKKTERKISNVNRSLVELQKYLNGEIFRSVKDDIEKLKSGEIVLSDSDIEEDIGIEKGNYEVNDDDNQDDDDEYEEDNVGLVTPSSSLVGATKNIASFETSAEFDLNDFGLFDLTQRYLNQQSFSSTSVLKYYIYNNDICIHPLNLSEIINGIGVQSVSYINKFQQDQDIISSPSFLNMVCSYANTLFERIPKFKNYAFAFGGVKWLVGQVLFFGLYNSKTEQLIKPVLFNSNKFNEVNYQILVDNITKYLELSWLKDQQSVETNLSLLLLHSDTLFPAEKDSTNSHILHQWFYPTALQAHLLKTEKYVDYPHWVNFIIWPEMRDLLLLNIKKLSMPVQDTFYDNLMDNVILLIKDENSDNDKSKQKMFFFTDLTQLINLTVNHPESKCEPSLERLTSLGLFSPREWSLTRTYARKFGQLIPQQLVCWDLDDKSEENIVRPHLVS